MKRSIFFFFGKAGANCFLFCSFMMAMFSFSSCEEWQDINQSMALSGEWRGDFGMYYDYIDGRGRRYTFDCYDSRISFIPAYAHASYGRGTQVDYYDYGPYEYLYYKFSWSVENGVVYLSYDYDHELDVRISNYSMNNDYFSGIFSSSGNSFRLRKIADYYNWTPYVNIYGYEDRYGWDYDYYYDAPFSRSEGEQLADSIASEGKVLARGRRSSALQQ